MAEEKKLLEISVETEQLPERLSINGVEYRQVDRAPNPRAKILHETTQFFWRHYSPEVALSLLHHWAAGLAF